MIPSSKSTFKASQGLAAGSFLQVMAPSSAGRPRHIWALLFSYKSKPNWSCGCTVVWLGHAPRSLPGQAEAEGWVRPEPWVLPALCSPCSIPPLQESSSCSAGKKPAENWRGRERAETRCKTELLRVSCSPWHCISLQLDAKPPFG